MASVVDQSRGFIGQLGEVTFNFILGWGEMARFRAGRFFAG